jgi:hypothetical protein
MSHDPHIPRFMCYLSLFTFFMLMLVTADNFTMAIFLAILFLGVYGIIIAGWFSNYKDGFLRSLRSAAQMVSYKFFLNKKKFLALIFLKSSFVIIVGTATYILCSQLDPIIHHATNGLTVWLMNEWKDNFNGIFSFSFEINLITFYVGIALVNYIASLILYILTKRYNLLFPLILILLNLTLSIEMVTTPSSINGTFFVSGVNCGFTQLTASILVLNTLFLLLLFALQTFFFTERSEREVVFSLGCLLWQIITPLILIKITALKLDEELPFSEQVVGSLLVSFLLSQGIVVVFFSIVNFIKKQRLKLGKIKFELQYSPVLYFLFFINPKAIEMLALGQGFLGINLTIWVYLPLLGISLLLWAHSKCKAQIKEEWVLKIREQVISHIFLFILYSRLLVFVAGLLDGSILASQVKMLFCIIDVFYLQTVTAEMWTCMMMPGDLRSAEGTPTGGPQTSSAEQVVTPTGSATATASSFKRYIPTPPPEGLATVRDRDWIIEKLAYPATTATGRRPFDFMLSLGYFPGLQEAVERRVLFNEIGEYYPSSFVSQMIREKNAHVHTTLQSVSEQYRIFYLKKVELDQRLYASTENLFHLKRYYEALNKVSDTHTLGSFESQTVKLAKEYGESSHAVFSAFFEKVKELDITQKEWGDDLALISASDQSRVRKMIFIETQRQASFNREPRILRLDGRDISTLFKAPISDIQSLCKDRLKIAATRTSISDSSSTQVEFSDPQFFTLSNQIRIIFAHFRSEYFQNITRVEDELQRRTVEVGKIIQELKRIGR